MDSLPPELWDEILRPLEPGSLKYLRLMNKRLARIVAPTLFRDAQVLLQAESLHRLRDLSRSCLSHHIKFLAFGNNSLPEAILTPWSFTTAIQSSLLQAQFRLDKSQYMDPGFARALTKENFDQESEPDMLLDLGWTREELFDAWKLHRDRVLEQAVLMASGAHVDMLTECLTKFSNLSVVHFAPNEQGEGNGSKVKLAERRGIKIFSLWDKQTRKYGYQIKSFLLAAAMVSNSRDQQNNSLTGLMIDERFWSRAQAARTGSRYHDQLDSGSVTLKTMKMALPFLSKLRTLQMPLMPSQYSAENIEVFLRPVLAGLPQLENLEIVDYGRQYLRLQAPLSTLSTQNLQSLCLCGFSWEFSAAMAFFKRHATSLRCLHLGNMILADGEFCELFASFPSNLRGKLSEAPSNLKLTGYFIELGKFDGVSLNIGSAYNPEEYAAVEIRRESARQMIQEFVRGEREWPQHELGWEDVSISEPQPGVTVVIGGNQLPKQWVSNRVCIARGLTLYQRSSSLHYIDRRDWEDIY